MLSVLEDQDQIDLDCRVRECVMGLSRALLVPLACLAVANAQHGAPAGTGDGDACNFGPTHHSHLVLPTSSSAEDCVLPSATFVLSHGATFFCPHTFDVKLLATIREDDARSILCETHFKAVEERISSKVLLRPTLPAGGLPALSRGQMASWASPVMYHVHNFGHDNSAGPDEGWNVTILRGGGAENANTTIDVVRVLYGRLLDVQPRPTVLTFLAHNASGKIVLSHYVSTSGQSGFDQLATVRMTASNSLSSGLFLRDTWPTFLTITGREDSMAETLQEGETNVPGVLHMYNETTGLPLEVDVLLDVILGYYVGASDGFAGYGTMCPFKQGPQSPTTCGM